MSDQAFVGLRPFSGADAPRFFGRDEETDRLCAFVLQNPITFLTGPSGIGKTSLIHAGLLPALRTQAPHLNVILTRVADDPTRDLVASMNPDAAQSSASVDLAAMFAKSGAETLIVLDQYEEMFTLADTEGRRAFEQALFDAATAGHVRLLISLRSDYLAEALSRVPYHDRYPPLLLLGPLSHASIRRMIHEAVGTETETGEQIFEALLREIGPQPNTAMLQMVLSAAFRSRQALVAREKTLWGNLRTWVERIWGEATTADRVAMRRVLQQLVTPAGTRSVLRTGDLSSTEIASLEELARAGLVTRRADHSGLAVAELAHDALISTVAEIISADVPTKRNAVVSERPFPRAEVFVSYAREDLASALSVYDALKARGFYPWIDKRNILAGQDWAYEIAQALRRADYIVICLSTKAYQKRGYVQREIKMALDRCAEIPPGEAFVFPARIDDCPVPSEIARYQYADLFQPDGLGFLLESMVREWDGRSSGRGA